MANDFSLLVRRAVLTHLKADAAVAALVPAGSIYPPQTPPERAWPFIRYGAATQLPFKPSGTDGSRIVGAVHVFARGPGEDAASLAGAAVARSIDEALMPLPDGLTAIISHAGNTVLQDPEEADAWHIVVNFEAVVSAPR